MRARSVRFSAWTGVPSVTSVRQRGAASVAKTMPMWLPQALPIQSTGSSTPSSSSIVPAAAAHSARV